MIIVVEDRFAPFPKSSDTGRIAEGLTVGLRDLMRLAFDAASKRQGCI